ncbi:DNA internalization-related competence protein ComEC/Rec2 [Wukongibacter baidiensis]|uniref:DNA internalization-related competence protein ComEC/Rec2 n=1 Tax=Wukongibacter baidiensis TaxID=1723361 RepID=UPI003D7FF6C6
MYRRPLAGITIAVILGSIIQYYLRLPIQVLLVAICINIIVVIFFLYRKNRMVITSVLLAMTILGALNLEYNYITENPAKIFIDKDVEIIGDCIQKEVTDKSTYVLIIREIRHDGRSYSLEDKSILRIYKYKGKSLNNKRVKVKGKLQIPDAARNPRMFDYNLYLRTQGIYTITKAKKHGVEVIGPADLPYFIDLRHKIKSCIYKGTFENFPGEEGKVALSITFGDKKIIDEDIYENFKTNGTAHALAVSGLHFGILFMFINFILNLLRTTEKYKVTISILLIWFFALIVGFTPSVIRASSMITLLSISNHLDRRYDLFTALAFICLANIVVNPFMIFNIGFQLSFSAVIAIGLFYRPIYKGLSLLPDFLRQMVAVTLAAQIGTAPIIAYYFNMFSPIALIINIPVVLLMGIVLPVNLVFFITLFINASLSQYVAYVDGMLIKLLVWINSLSSYVSFSKFSVASPNFTVIILFYIFLILICYKEKIPYIKEIKTKNIVAILFVVILCMNVFEILRPKDLRLTFVDVGQGDCILIETPKGKRILVDGGKEQEDFLSGFLLKNGISYIDLICVSHIHNDHIGGIANVLENIKTGQMVIGTKEYTSEEWQEIERICLENKIPIMEFSKGKIIRLEKDLTLTAVYPKAELIENTNEDTNNNSLVLILEYKDFEVVLTGDIEKEAEMDIVRGGFKRDVDVLKVGHHGSKTSSTPEFLDSFTPEIAVIQVGKNVFGHPHGDTLNKLKEREIKIYRNDKNGAVIIETDGKNIEVKTMLSHE